MELLREVYETIIVWYGDGKVNLREICVMSKKFIAIISRVFSRFWYPQNMDRHQPHHHDAHVHQGLTGHQGTHVNHAQHWPPHGLLRYYGLLSHHKHHDVLTPCYREPPGYHFHSAHHSPPRHHVPIDHHVIFGQHALPGHRTPAGNHAPHGHHTESEIIVKSSIMVVKNNFLNIILIWTMSSEISSENQ
ncbi:hypothetical protein Bhyg_04841 [Pseudolycoriella hygida]|uniref:Uncharacterized protein n=1 Tax=Pseudolycoriella hygida TaxID=35572 RepID=A0A9Q0NGD4_9DIPT|nr:hypothetical protein Bhyg_04841 [Pseudolycoriella hygida]